MKRMILISWVILVMIMLSSCGPSAGQVATMTASAWTPTPPPTPTPTPIPYGLTVSVADEAGAPIPAAAIAFPGSGNDQQVLTDAQGKYDWTNLPDPAAALDVSAQGYVPAQQTASLERGSNQIKVTLKRDPSGLLPAEACAPGEKLLYAEDFQDGQAQGWNEIDLQAPGWQIAPAADNADNKIVSAQYSEMAAEGPVASRLDGYVFDNAVWRVHFQVSKPFPSGETWFSFNWRHAPQPFDLNGQQVFDSRYQLPIGYNYFAMRRLQQPVTNIGLGQVKNPSFGKWHLAEIGTYQGTTEAWMDGKRLMSYKDPKLVPPGGIDLELWLKDSGVTVYFDNISVCELSAPIQSIASTAP